MKYEDCNVKIEIENGNINYTNKTPSGSPKDNIDLAVSVFKYIKKSMKEIGHELD